MTKKETIRNIQTRLGGLVVDGIAGDKTWARLRAWFEAQPDWSGLLAAIPEKPRNLVVLEGLIVTQESIDLIASFEGVDQPGKWPGYDSGITIGRGFDLGYVTASWFRQVWGKHLSEAHLKRLETAIGVKGTKAKAMESQFKDIRITTAAADAVFLEHYLPDKARRTRSAFPGVEKLDPSVQGALLSLVTNRGESMTHPSLDRRKEMREIQAAVPKGDLRAIAAALRSMTRLWEGAGMAGLIRRREAEAKLVEQAIALA